MVHWRAAAFVLVALLTASLAHAQQSGVLIGVLVDSMSSDSPETFDQIQAPKYRTLWVAPDSEAKLGLLASISDLIVPRKDGFWHVGVKQVCEFSHEPTDEDGGNESIAQSVWRAPVAEPGMVPVSRPCTAHDPSDYAPPYGRTEIEKNKISQCGYQLTQILYASPAIISLRTYSGQSGDCEARGGRYNVDFSVIGYESNVNLAVSQVLGEAARAAYLKALPQEAVADDGDRCAEPNEEDTGWRINRAAGRWTIFAHQDLGYFGCSVDALVPFRLPSSVTGDPSPSLDWKLLKSKVKSFQDAFLSPDKDLLLVQTQTELQFYEYGEDGPGKLLLTLPAYPIVMVQWSAGNHVQDWTQQLQSMVAHPLPEPQIQLPPSN